MRIRIGTRQSPLALWQATTVAGLLTKAGHEIELVKIKTEGDVTTTPLSAAGGAGVFTKEIQRALLDGRCDVAVHSLKDLPTLPVEGLQLSAVPEREKIADTLLSRKYKSLAELPVAAKIGTGSPRRQAQLLRLRPDLEILDIRGNVESRIGKLDAGEYDAIVLAYAGLHRLELTSNITEVFTAEQVLPAVGQAALGLETRVDDQETTSAVRKLSDPVSHFAVLLERTMLLSLKAGCLTPLAALATVRDSQVSLKARVFSADYSEMIEQHWSWNLTDMSSGDSAAGDQINAGLLSHSIAIELGQQAANDLITLGADELIHPENYEDEEEDSDKD